MKLEISNQIFFTEVERLIAESECVTITIKGNSMRPWLKDGRHKVVLMPPARELQVGDVALFRYKQSHVLHRAIEISGKRVIFAGDGNINLREEATKDDIVAIVKSVISPRGRVICCTSREWRVKSKIWLCLPQIVRRVILAIGRRL